MMPRCSWSPASEISRLDWLTNAEDDARTDAASLAVKTAAATPTEDVEARVGDSDPLKAIEVALRTFAADEFLVVAHPVDHAGGLVVGAGATAQALQPSSHARQGRRRRIARET
jgi:hypothetical protein